jgi:hypothetical protein
VTRARSDGCKLLYLRQLQWPFRSASARSNPEGQLASRFAILLLHLFLVVVRGFRIAGVRLVVSPDTTVRFTSLVPRSISAQI